MHKQKVQPVLDYWELNGFVEAFTANAEVCIQKLREWQWQGVDVSLLDLWNAYLQIHIDKALQLFQMVVFKGKRFCLTQLGLGLNVAPLIMRSIVDITTSQICVMKSAMLVYIDIFINESLVSAACVQQYCLDHSLVCKNPDWLRDRTKVLSLQI